MFIQTAISSAISKAAKPIETIFVLTGVEEGGRSLKCCTEVIAFMIFSAARSRKH